MRFLRYGTHLYEKYIATTDYYEYSTRLQKIPRPVCVCFYNGLQSQPERQVLRLSDAYEGEGDIEVSVTMLNINYGKNRELMNACEPLYEYSWLVDAIRRHEQAGKMLVHAVDAAVEEMPNEFIIKPFIIANQAEVRSMLFVEYNEEKIRQSDRAEGRAEGREEGWAEGRAEGREEGRAEGREEGRAEGREEGRAEGREEGRAEGREEGREEGRAEGKEEGENKLGQLMMKLQELGRINDAFKAAGDPKFREAMYTEFSID